MMNTKRRALALEEFPDLDKLVLREIEAMVERTYSEVCPRNQDVPPRRDTDKRRVKQKNVRPSRATRREADDPQPDEYASASTDNELLSKEDQKFVDDTVAWLRQRGNADMLIATVWSRVVDSDTEAFHAAAPAVSAETEDPGAPQSEEPEPLP